RLLRWSWTVMLVFVGIVAFTAWWYNRVPTGFLPIEDQGYIMVSMQLPDAASLERNREVVDKVNAIIEKTEGVQDYFAIGGLSLLDGSASSNASTFFIMFKDWDERTEPHLSLDALVNTFNTEFAQIQE